MKKNIIIFMMGIVLLFSFTGCHNNKETSNADAVKFKEEYEALNNTKNEKNGKQHRVLDFDEDNSFIYTSASEIIKMMEDKENFVVYFGFASCPWCRSAIPTLMEVADDLELYPIYYVDVKEIRDTKVINEEGKVVTEKEGTEEYYQLLEKMDSVLENYTLTNQDGNEVETGEKRIYAPNIVSVIDGEAVELTDGISPNQTDAYMELTDKMKKESYDKIKSSIKSVAEIKNTCSTGTKC